VKMEARKVVDGAKTGCCHTYGCGFRFSVLNKWSPLAPTPTLLGLG
jgi:hypothetical protein